MQKEPDVNIPTPGFIFVSKKKGDLVKSFSAPALFIFITIAAVLTSCAPKPPELISPVDGSTNTSQTPDLKWSSSKWANSYELEVSADSGVVYSAKGLKTSHCPVPSGKLSSSAFYSWRVRAFGFTGKSEWSENWSFKTLSVSGNPFAFLSENDSDGDGIPDEIENNLLKTDPVRKTLFVRPKKETATNQFVYWGEFIQLFPDARPGFANIPPFSRAGIEIVVIGNDDPGFPYEPMQNFHYDPAQDPNKPPCNILELIYSTGTFCPYGAHYSGHTFFTGNVWSWDTLGYTIKSSSTHRYFLPSIYSLAIDRYLREGAYEEISTETEASRLDCSSGNCNKRSPMNLNDLEQGPPYRQDPDRTAEFNDISFDGSGKITFIGKPGKRYRLEEVLKRVIIHEMGHAILSADSQDHCDNPKCIMHRWTENWEPLDFGPAAISCQHTRGGSRDIRANGVIYNTTH
jgi:hypothetical protein